MPDPTVVNVLNRLLALHARSLPMYLNSARPWVPSSERESQEVLRHIAEDHQLMVERIGTVILGLDGNIEPSEFPIEFTDLHDLSIGFLIPLVASRQQREIDWIRQNLESLKSEPAALAIAEEALGAAQGNLDSLNELSQAVG